MGQVCECWWRICREINALHRFEFHHVLRFMSICDPFTDSPSYLLRYDAVHVGKGEVVPVFS
jgi:hypothetical protein